MMPTTTYDYNIAEGKVPVIWRSTMVEPDVWEDTGIHPDILQSDIVPPVHGCTYDYDTRVLVAEFEGEISTAEKTTLDNIVAANLEDA